MDIREQLQTQIAHIIKDLSGSEKPVKLEIPADLSHGDYTTNVAFMLSKDLKQSPLAVAEMLAEKLREKHIEGVENISVAKPGFVNISLTKDQLISQVSESLMDAKNLANSTKLTGKKIMVEFAHPNTHKEMHIGHMRTLITGEALCRIFEAVGADVFRANYQGDIGPHVAKAIFGMKEMTKDENPSLDAVRAMSNYEKAHILGQAYALGSSLYEEHKGEIDLINSELYSGGGSDWELYQETRQWSLDYYDEFYMRFYTSFNKLFFESQMVKRGKTIVEENIGDVFTKDNGAIVFKGEEYGLHTRVFITQAGNPTYEGKEMGNAFSEYETFPFDLKMHIVANEQAGYFQVVFKALELIDPEKFKDKQYHLSMGMVQLADRKMSSRTGDVLTVDWLLDQVKEKAKELFASGRVKAEDIEKVAEEITIGAVKHSVLKVGVGMDAAFDIEKSVALDGNSGPYLQYTFARTQSVLAKAEINDLQVYTPMSFDPAEELLLRMLIHFREVIVNAAEKYSPNVLATYLFEIAQQFNQFYQACPILKADGDTRDFRLFVTAKTGEVLKKGLDLLGIKAPEKM